MRSSVYISMKLRTFLLASATTLRHVAASFLVILGLVLCFAPGHGPGTVAFAATSPVITSFTANPASIAAGQSSALSWSVSNATSITIDHGIGIIVGSMSVTVLPSVTTSYHLTATNSQGSTTAQTTVTVTSTTPPTVPTGLTGSAVSSSQINLTWAASIDPNYAPSQLIYGCYRNGTRFAATAAGMTSCSDTGLTASTTYSYTVSVQDPAGNSSVQSASIQITTQAPAVVITSFTASPTSILAGQSSTLLWSVSNATSLNMDNGVGNVTGSTSLVVHPSVTTTYHLTATNSQGSTTAQTTVTINQDTTPPTVPAGLTGNAISTSVVNLTWTASNDPDNAPSQIIYGCYRNGTRFATTPAGITSCNDTGLTASTTYSYTVSAQDPAGNSSAQSASVQVTTGSSSLSPVITSFTANPASIATGQSSTLSWSVSNANSVTVDNGIGSAPGGGTSVVVHPSVTTTYHLTATNSQGSATAQTTVTINQDTTPPTVPTGLTAAAVSASQINLSWSASTDNIAVAGYRVYRNGSLIATAGATAYSDMGLSASTTYTYNVAAYDTAGNASSQSAPASATTSGAADTQAPTVSITAPTEGAVLSGSVTITANAADKVGVAGVRFYVDGAALGQQLATAPYATTWNTALATNSSHVLTAIARDAAGNTATSAAVTVTVNNTSSNKPYGTNFPRTENPISENNNWINGLATGLDWGDVRTSPGLAFGTTLSPPPPYNDSTAVLSGVWGPNQTVQATVHTVNQNSSIFEEVELRLRTTITAHSITGYEVNFRATSDGSQYCTTVIWPGPLNQWAELDGRGAPTCPGLHEGDVVTATAIGSSICSYVNGTLIYCVNDSTFPNGSPGMGFYLSGTSSNAALADFGITSFSASDGSTTDTTAPSTPTNVSATGVSSSQIKLTWNPSTDNVLVSGYRIFRNNIQIATSASTSFADTGLNPTTQYSYTIAAFDAAGNVSAQSLPVTGTTLTFDTTPPSVPSGLKSSNVGQTSLTISWTPSTDVIGVAGYQVFRNGNLVGTTTSASYVDSGLLASTTYAYSVAAYDSSSNYSSRSPQILVTTAATSQHPPTFVQMSQDQISNGSATSVAFNSSTTTGNTIVAYVIWSNSASVIVTDSQGDTFTSVSAPVIWGDGNSAQVFYATNIEGGADTVTATFRNSVSSFGVAYIHEYSGISATNPIDVTVSATGSSASLNSGSATTTNLNDLIFGAGVSDRSVTAAGAGFIARSLAFGNITEDRPATSTGSYAATATHDGAAWAMQMVAFRAN